MSIRGFDDILTAENGQIGIFWSHLRPELPAHVIHLPLRCMSMCITHTTSSVGSNNSRILWTNHSPSVQFPCSPSEEMSSPASGPSVRSHSYTLLFLSLPVSNIPRFHPYCHCLRVGAHGFLPRQAIAF